LAISALVLVVSLGFITSQEDSMIIPLDTAVHPYQATDHGRPDFTFDPRIA